MSASDEQAAGIATLLAASNQTLGFIVEVSAVGGSLVVDADDPPPGAVLELRPPAQSGEVPVWVELSHGRTDLHELSFQPEEVTVVRWDAEHVHDGLVLGYPQMLDGTAVAGSDHCVPIAGGRRGDGRLELWIEASPTGSVTAFVDAVASLGVLAELRWQAPSGDGRLLVALVEYASGRRVGVATLPVDPRGGLRWAGLVVHHDLAAAGADTALVAASRLAAATPLGRACWQSLTVLDLVEGARAADRAN